MAKKRLLRTNVFPYHVYARSNNREHFPLNLFSFWELLVETAMKTSDSYQLNFHALVLMPNHFHAIVSTPDGNLDAGMQYLLREMSKKVNFITERMNHLWGGRYKWSSIQSEYYYETVYRYVYQNPLRAGICSNVEIYPYCSWDMDRVKGLEITTQPEGFPTPPLLSGSM